MTISIGWFSTGRGPGSRGLFEFVQQRILRREIPAQIEFVFSNRDPAEDEGSDLFFDLVRRDKIPIVTASSNYFRRKFKGGSPARRVEYDRRAMTLIEKYKPDICILAGYMLIVGPEMCRQYTMLNLHPALPTGPIGTWQEAIWQLVESKSHETGAMVHLALEEVDRGPVVSYFTIPLTGRAYAKDWDQVMGLSIQQLKQIYGENLPLFQRIRQEEYRREPYLLAETIRAVALGQVIIKNFKVFDYQGHPWKGLHLNERIEALLKSDEG